MLAPPRFFARALVGLALVAPASALAQTPQPLGPTQQPSPQPAGTTPPTPTPQGATTGTLTGPSSTTTGAEVGQTATNTPATPRDPATGQAAPNPPVSTPPPAPRRLQLTPPGTTAAPVNFLTRLIEGFSFGSYGRVAIGTDLRGRLGRFANIVAFGTRIDEQTYAELEVHRDDNFGPVHTRVVATLAIQGPLFHESGQFDISMAVRNLYIEERGAFTPGLSFWIGSRMYRGDDIYLLNWWPLDNLNTVGGGARYDLGEHLTFAVHGGANRLDTSYQYQQIRVTPRDGVGGVNIALLDRPRGIVSFKATWWLNGRSAPTGLKVVLYGEGHGIPEGVRQNTDSGRFEVMPADSGYVIGAQVGAYTRRNTFANLFFRYSQGLGAYGDLAVPFTLTARQTSARARDVRLAVAGNYEVGPFGVLLGAYVRYFQDADAAIYGRNDLFEGTISVRPQVWIGNHFGIAGEVNYQGVMYNMLDAVTGAPRGGSLWRFALIPFVTPAGRGSFTRPHLRVIYALSVRDEGARRLYAPDDPFARNTLEHYLAFNCEWWFNSSYM